MAIEGHNVNLEIDEQGRTNLSMRDILQLARPTSSTWKEVFEVFQLRPEALRGIRVLDVGAGGSDVTAKMMELEADAYAIDPRYNNLAGLIEQIRGLHDDLLDGQDPAKLSLENFIKSVKSTPSRYIAGSATSIPFKENTFDLVISRAAVTFHLDFDSEVFSGAIEECIRVTKPGGTIRLSLLKTYVELSFWGAKRLQNLILVRILDKPE